MDEPAGSAGKRSDVAAEDDIRLSDLRTVVLTTGNDQLGRASTRVALVHKQDVGKLKDLLDSLMR